MDRLSTRIGQLLDKQGSLKADLEVVARLTGDGMAWGLAIACCLAKRDEEILARLLPVLVESFENGDDHDRSQAAFAVEQFGPAGATAVPALAELLRPENAGEEGCVRHIATRAMIALGTAASAAVPALIEVLRELGPEADDLVLVDVLNATMALAAIGPAAHEALPVLEEIVRREPASEMDRWLRLEAARAIWQISGNASVSLEIAVALLGDDEWWLRGHAIDLLGDLGPLALEAASHVDRATRDNHHVVRQRATEALKRLTAV